MAKMREVPEIDFTKPVADQIEAIADIESENSRLERSKTYLRQVTDFKKQIRRYEGLVAAARKAADEWRSDLVKEINEGGFGDVAHNKHYNAAYSKLRLDR